MEKSKVSFVLPTYNRAGWLAECIESLRKQTLKEIEIIVIDDRSTDTTHELMTWYIKQDDRIKYIVNEKNIGAGKSRNIGNKAATGEIICVCDSDDYYPEYRAEFTLDYFNKNKDVDLMNGSYYRVDYSNNILQEYKAEEYGAKEFAKRFNDKKEVYFCHPSCAYRRENILQTPYRKETESVTDDYQLLQDWVKEGKKIRGVNKILCFHRVLPGSIMTNMRGGSLE